jgi:SNF2 family DNA or RNA helicase
VTDYHAKYLAHELTRRCASDSVEKLTAVLSDAQVDVNPHQVEAALFAFRSPLSRGAILADEVGLGKTIEAGLLIAQSWAGGKRQILVIAPANLRKQWGQELSDKFFLPSVILETKTFNEALRAGNLNPFQRNAVVICSYQFARKMDPYVKQTKWDLVVIDEAHRLRNVYKPTNKIANAIKEAVAPNLPEKLEIQRKLRTLEAKRDEAWRAYDAAARDVEKQKDSLLDEIGRRLQQQTASDSLFCLRWRVQ